MSIKSVLQIIRGKTKTSCELF